VHKPLYSSNTKSLLILLFLARDCKCISEVLCNLMFLPTPEKTAPDEIFAVDCSGAFSETLHNKVIRLPVFKRILDQDFAEIIHNFKGLDIGEAVNEPRPVHGDRISVFSIVQPLFNRFVI
jgi:hypothetical protein